jgi:hypothetical protein
MTVQSFEKRGKTHIIKNASSVQEIGAIYQEFCGLYAFTTK